MCVCVCVVCVYPHVHVHTNVLVHSALCMISVGCVDQVLLAQILAVCVLVHSILA